MASPGFDKACQLLARRPHFRAELERKLGERGHDEAEIAAAMSRLEELGYLDDAGCARSLAAGPLSRRGYGPLRMRAELERRGAPAAVAEEAVAEIFAGGDAVAARRAGERWLARHLQRKGFTAGTALEVVRELVGEDDDESGLSAGR